MDLNGSEYSHAVALTFQRVDNAWPPFSLVSHVRNSTSLLRLSLLVATSLSLSHVRHSIRDRSLWHQERGNHISPRHEREWVSQVSLGCWHVKLTAPLTCDIGGAVGCSVRAWREGVCRSDLLPPPLPFDLFLHARLCTFSSCAFHRFLGDLVVLHSVRP